MKKHKKTRNFDYLTWLATRQLTICNSNHVNFSIRSHALNTIVYYETKEENIKRRKK